MKSLLSTLLIVIGVYFLESAALADVSVPPKLQAQLIGRIASFDRNFATRAGSNALILLFYKSDDVNSSRMSVAMSAALDGVADIGGVSKTVEVISYTSVKQLVDAVASRKPAIVYISVGLEDVAKNIATSLRGAPVMTIGATGILAEQGINIGFDLEGSRPKIVVNLGTAKAQNIDLKAEFLKLARIVD